MKLYDLETPCLVLDIGKVKDNIYKLNRHVSEFRVPIRPHGKTAKNSDILKMVADSVNSGITVSTLKEAEYYFESGFKDILYAVGIVPSKLDRIERLIKKGAEITVILDSVEQAELIIYKCKELGIILPVLIEIDSDDHRSGVKPGSPDLIEIAKLLNSSSSVLLKGVITHAGDSYLCKSVDEIKVAADNERKSAVICAEILKENSLPCPVVSIGSTPTVTFTENLDGITEVRAGVYMFQDLVMAGLGVCSKDEIALSVMTSVIGYQKEKNWIITDSGWMALSRDRGTAAQNIDQGYGVVCDIDGNPIFDLIVTSANQEHGIISSRSGKSINWNDYPIGSRLRILPNHACATGAMHDKYHVVEKTADVIKILPRINGW